jgi:hypothetical protein
MNSNIKFWLIIYTFLAFGLLFLALGVYVVGNYVLHAIGVFSGGDLESLAQQAAIGGLGGFIAGGMLTRKSIQWIRHAKRNSVNANYKLCSHCGAVIHKSETRCKKCGKLLPA